MLKGGEPMTAELAAVADRDALVDALFAARDEAATIRDPRSPAAAVVHERINGLLDQLVGR